MYDEAKKSKTRNEQLYRELQAEVQNINKRLGREVVRMANFFFPVNLFASNKVEISSKLSAETDDKNFEAYKSALLTTPAKAETKAKSGGSSTKKGGPIKESDAVKVTPAQSGGSSTKKGGSMKESDAVEVTPAPDLNPVSAPNLTTDSDKRVTRSSTNPPTGDSISGGGCSSPYVVVDAPAKVVKTKRNRAKKGEKKELKKDSENAKNKIVPPFGIIFSLRPFLKKNGSFLVIGDEKDIMLNSLLLLNSLMPEDSKFKFYEPFKMNRSELLMAAEFAVTQYDAIIVNLSFTNKDAILRKVIELNKPAFLLWTWPSIGNQYYFFGFFVVFITI